MTTKLEKLLVALEKMELKLEKLETKKDKAFSAIASAVKKIEKVGIPVQDAVDKIDSTTSSTFYATQHSLDEAFQLSLNTYGDTQAFNWLVSIKMKFDTIYRTNTEIRLTKEKIDAQQAKIAELENELNDFDKLPMNIQNYLNEYTELVKEWLRKNTNMDEDKIQKDSEFDKLVQASVLKMKVERFTGNITDGQMLTIENGQLNGYITGEKGRALVQTVLAGGWNIQKFHLRTLVHSA